MVSSKSLCFAVFALSAAILTVQSSPLAKVDEPVVEGKPHNLLAGKREPGDYLAQELGIFEYIQQGENSQMMLRRELRVSPYEVITQLNVTDLLANGEGPEVSITSGGPGSEHVSLLFQTEHYHGVNVFIQVYAKHDDQTQ